MLNPNNKGLFYTDGIKAADLGADSKLRNSVNMQMVDDVVTLLMTPNPKIGYPGIRTNADVIDYETLYNLQANNKATPFMPIALSKDHVKRANLAKTAGWDNYIQRGNVSLAKNINFEQNGGFTVNNFNTIISQVITEVYDNSAETALAAVFPFSQYPAENVVVEVFAAPGGAIAPYKYGEPAQEVAKIGNRTYQFQGIPYRNYISIGEHDLTFWRDLGNPDISARGILQRITMYSMQAKVITNNRINLLRSTIFANGIDYYGDGNALTTVSYQIPLYNQVSSITDPVNQWGTVHTQTNRITVNPLANPIIDLYFYLKAYLPWISKFQRLRRCKMIMSPITEQLIVQNPNVQQQIAIVQAGPGTFNDPRGYHEAEFAMKSLIPGIEIEVMVDGSAYLLQNSDVTWQPSGAGFTNTPVPQQFFIPPGAILFAVDVEDKGGRLGEFVFTTSVQNGGFIQATAAPWFIIEDLTAPGTRGGPLNPSIQLDFGFAGGLQPYHPEATLLGQFAVLSNTPGPMIDDSRLLFVNPMGNGNVDVVMADGSKARTTTAKFKTAGTEGKSILTDVTVEKGMQL